MLNKTSGTNHKREASKYHAKDNFVWEQEGQESDLIVHVPKNEVDEAFHCGLQGGTRSHKPYILECMPL